jgi:hypothetical protein
MAKRGVMEVSLIFPEAETIRKYYRGLVYLAARTCYSEKTPQQIWDEFVADKTPPRTGDETDGACHRVGAPTARSSISASPSRLRE